MSTRRSRIVWICVLISLVLGVARGTSWEHLHDEGTTFDISVHEMAVGEYIVDWPSPPVPMGEIIDRLEGRTGHTVGDTVAALSTRFRTIHPPAYYVFVNLWTRLFGSGRMTMRLPSILLTALAVLGLAAIARRVIPGRHAGLWAAALFAVSPWVISITNLARPYQLALFLTVWATVAVLALHPTESSRRGRRWWWWAFGVCSLLGLYTVYHYAFVLAWHLCLLGLLALRSGPERRRGEWLALGGCVAGIAVGFAPWLPWLRTHMLMSSQGHNYFEGTVEASTAADKALDALADFALADVVQAPLGSRLLLAAGVLGLITLLLMCWAFLGKPRRQLDARAGAFWLTVPAMPLLLGLSDLWFGTHTLFITKLCFGFVILLILAVVHAWLVVPLAALRNAGLAAWVLLLALASVVGTNYRARLDNPLESATEVIAQDDSASHLVVMSTDLRGYGIPFLLTLRDAGVSNVAVTCARQKDLSSLLDGVEREGIYRRVSLVNHFIPQFSGTLMWDHLAVRSLLLSRFKKRGWHVARATKPKRLRFWSPPKPEDSDALTAWLFGPLRMRCIHGPR